MFVGVLGAVAACASVLGIENPSEPAGSDAGGEAAAVDVKAEVDDADDARLFPDVAEADPPTDGSVSDGPATTADGVPCGSGRCAPGSVCCYPSSGTPTCTTTGECANTSNKFTACDGAEDCSGHACCVFVTTGHFQAVCGSSTGCQGGVPEACHTDAGSTCNCKPVPNACLPLATCDGRCT
jgi:hypothetical protein